LYSGSPALVPPAISHAKACLVLAGIG